MYARTTDPAGPVGRSIGSPNFTLRIIHRMNRSLPPGPIIPTLAYADVRAAAEWLCRAFGFRVRLRIGGHRIQLLVGTGSLVVTELPEGAPMAGGDHGVMVPVPDVDAHYAQAVQHGARILRGPEDHPYGERQYTAEDPGGHRWTFTQTRFDSDPADWGGELVQAG